MELEGKKGYDLNFDCKKHNFYLNWFWLKKMLHRNNTGINNLELWPLPSFYLYINRGTYKDMDSLIFLKCVFSDLVWTLAYKNYTHAQNRIKQKPDGRVDRQIQVKIIIFNERRGTKNIFKYNYNLKLWKSAFERKFYLYYWYSYFDISSRN